jgi:alpha-galactosidase
MAKKSKGHVEHSKAAEDQHGFTGEFLRPINVTFMGAGSSFTLHLLSDLLQVPGAKEIRYTLVDIDSNRLKTMLRLCKLLAEKFGKDPSLIKATTDRKKALPGTDYIINCIEVSGLDCVKHDYQIPLKYGVDQCIGDTIGPGGLMKAMRTVPVFLDILRDCEELCPQALVLNYTNPMNIMCLAAGRTSSMNLIGLCHSVQGTSDGLAKRAGVPISEVEWECAGINHLAWFTTFKHQGKDLYPILMRKAKQDLAGKPSDPEDTGDLVRKHMMLQFGAFITESSGHFSEYLPYYRKRKDIIKQYIRPGYDGGSGFYASEWPKWRKDADIHRQEMIDGKREYGWPRTWEYASYIIEAREKDVPYRIHGNVLNQPRQGGGPLIENLPLNGCVEVPCMVDRNGITPTVYGKLPPQMAAICQSNMSFFDLAAEACIHKSKEMATHALMMDPLTSAICSLDEIRSMAEELFKAEKKFLRGFK